MKPITGLYFYESAISKYRVKHPIYGMVSRFMDCRLWNGVGLPDEGPVSWGEILRDSRAVLASYAPHFHESMRLELLAKNLPLILDLDDDVLNLDSRSQVLSGWSPQNFERVEKIPFGHAHDPEVLEKARRTGSAIREFKGDYYMVQLGQDLRTNVMRCVEAADAVTVSTKRLASVYGRVNPSVHVIPNALDFREWKRVEKQDGPIRLGLFGSNTHAADWREVTRSLAEILKKHPNVRLVHNYWIKETILKDAEGVEVSRKRQRQFPQCFMDDGLFEHPQVESHAPSKFEDWPSYLAAKQIDIGLGPLKDTLFNAGKSNLKYLEFSALRIPGVYSKTESYRDDIRHGENGFLARSPSDWFNILERLIKDAELRRKVGNAAFADVRKRYEAFETSKTLEKVIAQVIEKGPRAESLRERALHSGLVLAEGFSEPTFPR